MSSQVPLPCGSSPVLAISGHTVSSVPMDNRRHLCACHVKQRLEVSAALVFGSRRLSGLPCGRYCVTCLGVPQAYRALGTLMGGLTSYATFFSPVLQPET